jgi:hypothetical protein
MCVSRGLQQRRGTSGLRLLRLVCTQRVAAAPRHAYRSVAQVVCVGEAYLAAQVLELLIRNACTTDTHVF